MERSHRFWRTPSFTVAPIHSRREYTVEIKDLGGGTLGTCDSRGTVRDHSGDVLLRAPVRWQGRRNRPAKAEVEVADAGGRALGAARVIKYGLGPRVKKATVAILDPQGGEVARLQPRDRKGERLAIVSDTVELATVAVARIKSGFLRKAPVYTVEVADDISDMLRPLVVAVAIRYDALLNALLAASVERSARD